MEKREKPVPNRTGSQDDDFNTIDRGEYTLPGNAKPVSKRFTESVNGYEDNNEYS